MIHLGRSTTPNALGKLSNELEVRMFCGDEKMLPDTLQSLLPHLAVNGLLAIRLQILLHEIFFQWSAFTSCFLTGNCPTIIRVTPTAEAYFLVLKISGVWVDEYRDQSVLHTVIIQHLILEQLDVL